MHAWFRTPQSQNPRFSHLLFAWLFDIGEKSAMQTTLQSMQRQHPMLKRQSSMAKLRKLIRRMSSGKIKTKPTERQQSSPLPTPEEDQVPELPPVEKKKMTVDERKQAWLKLTMYVDRVVFVFMATVNIVSPIVIFYVIPRFQLLENDEAHH